MLRLHRSFMPQVAAAIFLTLAAAPDAYAESQDSASPQASAQAEILVDQKAGYATDKVEFRQISYTGENPGEVVVPRTIKARFASTTALTGLGRRVVIRNISPKMDNDPYPFVERKYLKGRYSEDFNLELGFRHRRGRLAVIPGENLLEYEVWQNDQLLQRSSLTVNVVVVDGGTFARQLPQPQYVAPYSTYGSCWDYYSCRHSSPYGSSRRRSHPQRIRRHRPRPARSASPKLQPARPAVDQNALLKLIQKKNNQPLPPSLAVPLQQPSPPPRRVPRPAQPTFDRNALLKLMQRNKAKPALPPQPAPKSSPASVPQTLRNLLQIKQ